MSLTSLPREMAGRMAKEMKLSLQMAHSVCQEISNPQTIVSAIVAARHLPRAPRAPLPPAGPPGRGRELIPAAGRDPHHKRPFLLTDRETRPSEAK